MIDAYRTIAAVAEGLYTEKGSKFIAFAFPVKTETDIKQHVEELKKQHFKARHHCYAYRLGTDGNAFRSNDDGEPAGTAGKPILGQIDSFELTDVLVVVVRYFGGTKLGVSGLINAYKTAAADALRLAEIRVCIVEERLQIAYRYDMTGQVMATLNKLEVRILAQDFSEGVTLTIAVQISKTEQLLKTLTERFFEHLSVKKLD